MSAPPPARGVPERIQRLLDERVLERSQPDAATITGLWIKAVHSGLDAREPALSTDNRVGLAFQAGLQAAFAFLAARGYRVRSGRSHHYYLFYATQALAEADRDEPLRRAAVEMDRQRTHRAVAVYNADPATEKELTEMLELLGRLLPAIHAALMRQLPRRLTDLPPPGERPPPRSDAVPKLPSRRRGR
ncbi:MAG: hypothetical protein ACREOJ_18515 [Gemmatimonadaceae bacterium]